MRAREFVAEALKPSQYRDLVKGWDSSRLADAFQQWPGEKNRTATRLYFDLPSTQTVAQAPDWVSEKIQQLGYEIVDYTRGLAQKKNANQNPTKIGKILTAAAQQGDSEANDALRLFQNDWQRTSTRAEYRGVISRHPYDVAGMSTDRGWTSCQELVVGSLCRFVPQDVRAGTLVVYMIKKDDVDIKAPVGRTLIKPYINDQNQTAYAPHKESYGSVTDEFLQAVNRFAGWLNRQQGISGAFVLHPDVYDSDNESPRIVTVSPDATEKEQIDLVRRDGNYIQSILLAGITPSEPVQLAAVKNYGDAIRWLFAAGIAPSQAVRDTAEDNGW
jgi:hypothetical protein